MLGFLFCKEEVIITNLWVICDRYKIIYVKLLTHHQFSNKGQIIITAVSVGRSKDLKSSKEAENADFRVKNL